MSPAPAPLPAKSSPWSASGSGVWLVALGLFLLPFYFAAFASPAAGYFNDDGIYIASAKYLAEGRGYRIPSLPGEPAQTKYPILFPALLAAVWKLHPEFPANIWTLKLVPLLATAGWLLVSRQLISRFVAGPAASWIVALTAATPLVIVFSATVMADALFALMATAALLWSHKAESPGGGARAAIVAAILAAAAFHTKTAGIAVIAATLLSLALHRRWREGVWYAGVAGALCLPWILWQAHNAGAGDSYNSWQTYAVSFNVLFNFDWPEKVDIVLRNAVFMVRPHLLPADLFPPVITKLLGLVFTLLVIIGLIRDMRRSLTVVHTFLIVYTVMLILWAWPPHRFMIAALPLAAYFAWCGIQRVFPPASVRIASRTGLVLLLSLAGATLARTGIRPGNGPPPMNEFHRNLDWPAFVAAMGPLKDSTPPDSIIITSLDPTIWLYTGRRTIREIDIFNPYEVVYLRKDPEPSRYWRDFARFAASRKATHILVAPGLDELTRHRRQIVQLLRLRYPEAFGRALDLGGRYTLHELNASKLPLR